MGNLLQAGSKNDPALLWQPGYHIFWFQSRGDASKSKRILLQLKGNLDVEPTVYRSSHPVVCLHVKGSGLH